MAEIRVKETGTIKLFESDNTSSVTIASPASLGADRTVTLPDASVTLVSGTMNDATALSGNIPVSNLNSGTSASSSTFWRGDGTWVAAGGANTPAFHAYLPSDQAPGDATWAVLSASTELYDSDGCYNTTNYKFTPTTAGKYFIYGQMHMDDASGDNMVLWAMGFKKNTSYVSITQMDGRGTTIGDAFTFSTATVVDMNGSSDYVQLWGYYDGISGSPRFMGGAERCFLGGYKLIGA